MRSPSGVQIGFDSALGLDANRIKGPLLGDRELGCRSLCRAPRRQHETRPGRGAGSGRQAPAPRLESHVPAGPPTRACAASSSRREREPGCPYATQRNARPRPPTSRDCRQRRPDRSRPRAGPGRTGRRAGTGRGIHQVTARNIFGLAAADQRFLLARPQIENGHLRGLRLVGCGDREEHTTAAGQHRWVPVIAPSLRPIRRCQYRRLTAGGPAYRSNPPDV